MMVSAAVVSAAAVAITVRVVIETVVRPDEMIRPSDRAKFAANAFNALVKAAPQTRRSKHKPGRLGRPRGERK